MNKKIIIGIDLGGTNLKIALLDLNCRIKNKEFLSTKKFAKKEDLISGIVFSINKIITDNKLEKKHIVGVGLGLPGPIDEKKGTVHFLPNIAGWKEVPLKRILEKKTGFPVFIDNDAKLMCRAEYMLGGAKGFRNAICITLGTGVGGGLIIRGKLYRGFNNAAGEVGHIPINEKGPKCNCGGIACLESYIGNTRILNEAKRIFKRDVSMEELDDLAKNKNKQALRIWADVGRRFGMALSGVVNLLNLDAIVIGGGVANAGKILFDKVRETIRYRAMPVQAQNVKILKAKLKNDAGMIGAAILVKEEMGL